MDQLLILTSEASVYAELVQQQLPDLPHIACQTPEAAIDFAETCSIILGSPAEVAQILPHAQQLQWVQSTFAGVNPLCVSEIRTDYTLTGVKEVFGPLMSEYVFAYIFAIERHIFETREHQAQSIWTNIPYRSLQGMTIGICGLGSIGTHIAKTAKHFGMHVMGYKNTATPHPEVEQVYTRNRLNEFLEQLDYLVITLPNTPQTKHLIDTEALKRMKPDSVLINVGRGRVIDETALMTALQKNRLRAAVLDVFQKEPLPPEHPLWQLPNVFITPHNAAYSFPKDIVRIFVENYQRFIERRPLKYVVDFERGY